MLYGEYNGFIFIEIKKKKSLDDDYKLVYPYNENNELYLSGSPK